MKKKFTVYGNCQAAALATQLMSHPRFAAQFDYVPIEPCFLVTREQMQHWLERHEGSLDLLVAQQLAPGWREDPVFDIATVARGLRPGAPLLRYTDIYFRGVDPLLAYPRTFPRLAHCDYIDLLSLTAAALGFPDPTLCASLHAAPDLLAPHEIEAIRALAAAELRRREADLELQAADEITSVCRINPAFHTFNHPANQVLECLARRVVAAVGAPDERGPQATGEHLATVHFPLAASIRAAYAQEAQPADAPVHLPNGQDYAPTDYFRLALDALAPLGIATLRVELDAQRADPISALVISAIERALCNRLALAPAVLAEVGRLYGQGVMPDFLLDKADTQAVGFMVDVIGMLRSTLMPRAIGASLSVLDLGGKSGAGSQLLGYLGQAGSFSKAKLGVTCADIDTTFRDYCRARHPHVEYLDTDVFTTGRLWDIVIASHVVEHVPHPTEFVRRLRSIARQYVVLAFPYQEDAAHLIPGHLHSLGHDFLRAIGPVRYEIYDGLFWSQSLCCIAVIDTRP
jgi:SAM-dependent methyltransferase